MVMAKVIAEPRTEVGKYAPKIEQISIDPSKIGDVVGKQGKVINKIIEGPALRSTFPTTEAVSGMRNR